MSDDEDDEIEEDPRIGQLYSAADKKSPEEFAAYVDSLGTKDAIVFGGMCTDAPTARAHFVVMALIDLEDDPLPECLTARRKLLKAAVEKGPAGSGKELIAALEGLICTSDAVEGEAKEAAKSSFDKALKVLWEYEIVSEEEIKSWQADERAGRHYRVSAAGQRLHDLGRVSRVGGAGRGGLEIAGDFVKLTEMCGQPRSVRICGLLRTVQPINTTGPREEQRYDEKYLHTRETETSST